MELTLSEAQELVIITNNQFTFWQKALEDHSNIRKLRSGLRKKVGGADHWSNPDYLNYWFIMTYLFIQEGHRAPKSELTGWKWSEEEQKKRGLTVPPRVLVYVGRDQTAEIPGVIHGIGYHATRRYMAQVRALGLAEDVGDDELQLTKNGLTVVEDTLASWHTHFGKLYEKSRNQRRSKKASNPVKARLNRYSPNALGT